MRLFNAMALILAFGCARERYNLRGVVVDDGGKPVENAVVSWWNGSCGDQAGRTPNVLGMTDFNGTFELEYTGAFRMAVAGLQVQKGGYAPLCVAAPNGKPECKAGDAKCAEFHVVLAKD
ncbi:MAG TPA: carboxypeptidase-like regulatory domain-containing protein [Myxococcales bacterium]|jgi:hypothetical protein|nr:carboxypeptidase-like regulatory domain-containing protein [Myxococcales bacterium]